MIIKWCNTNTKHNSKAKEIGKKLACEKFHEHKKEEISIQYSSIFIF